MSVLICYDGSASARNALEVAATTVSDDDVALLHVWNPPVAYLADAYADTGILADPSFAKLERLSEERAAEIASEGKQFAQAHGVELTVRVERAQTSVWKTILEVADELDCGLIVLGTRGLTVVKSALLGSVSNAVVHHSERPVMIVPGGSRASGLSHHEAEHLVAEGR